jgi:hypothetical protein
MDTTTLDNAETELQAWDILIEDMLRHDTQGNNGVIFDALVELHQTKQIDARAFAIIVLAMAETIHDLCGKLEAAQEQLQTIGRKAFWASRANKQIG